MRIVKLGLTNFKRFTSQEIDLGRPLTVLMGRNNSGKSTIMDALRIAFGGDLSQDEVYLNKKLRGTGTVEINVYCTLTADEWTSAIRILNTSYEFKL